MTTKTNSETKVYGPAWAVFCALFGELLMRLTGSNQAGVIGMLAATLVFWGFCVVRTKALLDRRAIAIRCVRGNSDDEKRT